MLRAVLGAGASADEPSFCSHGNEILSEETEDKETNKTHKTIT